MHVVHRKELICMCIYDLCKFQELYMQIFSHMQISGIDMLSIENNFRNCICKFQEFNNVDVIYYYLSFKK